ncbi:MAG: DUF975 family protein [Clostridiales Family XIII bacterium]|nr:DUF975 family protein [Clostridiales Family XIII bacterium]
MMRYEQLIITEPAANFRALARRGIRDRWGDAFLKGWLYVLVLSLPYVIILAMAGWLGFPGDNMNKLTDAYTDFLLGSTSQAQFMNSMDAMYNNLLMLPYLYQLLVTGALTFGITTVYLRYRRRQEAPTELLLSGFSHYSRSLALFLLMTIFTMLWTMLFIIPGIIAAYRYRLAFCILVDNPDIGPLEAINVSKGLMRGNKWKLFCLDISFIGWALLAVLACSIMTSVLVTPFVSGIVTGETPSYNMGMGVLFAIVTSLVTAVSMGLFYMYQGTASAAFYERASGLLKYTDERPVGTSL